MKQLTLNEVIEKLESLELTYEAHDDTTQDKSIRFDFCYKRPTEVSSWRGSYSEPCLGFTDLTSITAKELLAELKDSIGRVVTGYKGGEFVLRGESYLWVDQYNSSSTTGIFGLEDLGYELIIRTTYFEY
jgi:hypothetical protein